METISAGFAETPARSRAFESRSGRHLPIQISGSLSLGRLRSRRTKNSNSSPPDRLLKVAKVTIQDLGSIGEFVAAIATLATLVYLAVQIRQNTRTLYPASGIRT
jgi:hypothetical protein